MTEVILELGINNTSFKIGDNVKNGRKIGIVRWVGRLPGKSGIFYGIEYSIGHEGKHNGSFNDVKYFTCEDGQGAFVRTDSRVLKINGNKIKTTNNNNQRFGEVQNITVFQDLGDVDELGILNPGFQKNIRNYELTFINTKPWSYYVSVSLRDPARKNDANTNEVMINGKMVGHEIPCEISKTEPLKIVSSSKAEGTRYYNLITKQEQSFHEISTTRKDFLSDFLYSIMGCTKTTSQIIMQFCGYEAPSSENLAFTFKENQCIFKQCLNCRNDNFEIKYVPPKEEYNVCKINAAKRRRQFKYHSHWVKRENEALWIKNTRDKDKQRYYWCNEFLCERCGWMIKAYTPKKIKLITWAEIIDYFKVQLSFFKECDEKRVGGSRYYSVCTSIKKLEQLMNKNKRGELFADNQMIQEIRDLYKSTTTHIERGIYGKYKHLYWKMEKKRQLKQERKNRRR